MWKNTTSSTELSRDFCAGISPLQLGIVLVGPILDDRLKEKFLKPWKGVLCNHFCVCVCVSVCTRATEHIFWARNLFFGSSENWDMRKKWIFCFLKFSFLRFLLAFFDFFPLYNTSSFQDTPGPREQFFISFKVNFQGTYEMGLVSIGITMVCDLSFFLIKTMEMIEFHFRTTMVPGGYFFTFWSIFIGPMKGDWWLLI